MSKVFLPKKLKDVCSLQTGYDYPTVSDGSKATLLPVAYPLQPNATLVVACSYDALSTGTII
jgi:hypothetical protein